MCKQKSPEGTSSEPIEILRSKDDEGDFFILYFHGDGDYCLWVTSEPENDASGFSVRGTINQIFDPGMPCPEGWQRQFARFELGVAQLKWDKQMNNIPLDVDSFSELHNWVDANYYGGFLDQKQPLDIDEINEIQEALDNYIKAGYLKN